MYIITKLEKEEMQGNDERKRDEAKRGMYMQNQTIAYMA